METRSRDFLVLSSPTIEEIEECLNGRVFVPPQPKEPIKCFACALPSCMTPHAKLKKCSGCQVVSYCSVDCQRTHWPDHKTFCKKTATQMKQFYDKNNTLQIATGEKNGQKSVEIQNWINTMPGLNQTLRTEAATAKAMGRLPVIVVRRGSDHFAATVTEISENKEMVKKIIPENYMRPIDPHMEDCGMIVCVIAVIHTDGVYVVRGRV